MQVANTDNKGVKVKDISHITRNLSKGGFVLVLNTDASINPEAEAMLQALHSRSIGGIRSHLEVLAEKGPEKFMSTYYVGYGHKSIGDCGTATLFIEGVSMLVAKAVQDSQLYSGQEASTRYIDFSTQPFIDPVGTKESSKILEDYRAFYLHGLAVLVPFLKEQFPIGEGEKQNVYDKAVSARAFDIMRGFLPAGASTNLAWHGNLRQIADRILVLRHHPLAEVREVTEAIESAVLEALPSSFSNERFDHTEGYLDFAGKNFTYYDMDSSTDFELVRNTVNLAELARFRELLLRRPIKTELPRFLADLGTLQFQFMLDFGSFRDIQRHRAVRQRMPLVTTRHGFEPWYLSELPENFREEARKFLRAQEKCIKSLGTTPEIMQYYTAMGYRLPNLVTGDLPALVYLVELRATRFVHPTLRKRAKEMAGVLEREFGPEGLVLHLDKDPDRFDVRRGEQDIVKIS